MPSAGPQPRGLRMLPSAGRRWPRSRSAVPGSTNQTLSAQAFFPLPSRCDPAPCPPLAPPAPASLILLRSRPCPRPLAEGRQMPLEVGKGGPCPVGVRSSPGPSLHRAAPRGAQGGERRGSWGAGTHGCPWAMSLAAAKDPCPLAPPAAGAATLLSPAPIPGSGWKETVKYFCWRLRAGAIRSRSAASPRSYSKQSPARLLWVQSSNPSSWSTGQLRRALLPPLALLRAEELGLVPPAVPGDVVCGGSGAGAGCQHSPAAEPPRGSGLRVLLLYPLPGLERAAGG